MQPLFEDVAKRFYVYLFSSFGVGFVIFLWGYGLYAMFSQFRVPDISYIILAFTIFLIFCTVVLEHRGVAMPYLIVGGAFLSSILTFITICVVNGALWINKNGFPPVHEFLIMISISAIIGFLLIKLATMEKESYEY
ncbi:MAG: hypothetical protein ACLFVX_04095 [Archaeoglobaceae archaeon]